MSALTSDPLISLRNCLADERITNVCSILHPSLQTSLGDLFEPRDLLVSVILRDEGTDAERVVFVGSF